jgi:hypothetical protein
MLSGNQTELARKESDLIAVVEKILPDFARAYRAHDTPLSSCTKMRSPPIIRKRSIA